MAPCLQLILCNDILTGNTLKKMHQRLEKGFKRNFIAVGSNSHTVLVTVKMDFHLRNNVIHYNTDFQVRSSLRYGKYTRSTSRRDHWGVLEHLLSHYFSRMKFNTGTVRQRLLAAHGYVSNDHLHCVWDSMEAQKFVGNDNMHKPVLWFRPIRRNATTQAHFVLPPSFLHFSEILSCPINNLLSQRNLHCPFDSSNNNVMKDIVDRRQPVIQMLIATISF